MIRRRLLPVLALGLAGCAVESDYPSLAIRPVEKLAAAPATPPAATPTEAPSLAADLQAAVTAAEAGEERFRADLALAATAVAAAGGAAPGGELWVDAQQALSRAQAARMPVARALAALDAARTSSEDIPSPALLAAIDRVAALDAAQGDALRALEASLAAP